MSKNSGPGPLARFQAVIVDEESGYRQFVRAAGVAAAGLAGAYLLMALGIVDFSSAIVSTFEIAVGAAVSLFVLLGLFQFVVIARAYEHGAETVAETTEQLQEAAEEVETAADELDQTAETVEQAADEVTEHVDEAREKTEEAREHAGTAREVADDVKETIEKEREGLPEGGETDDIGE